MRDRNEKAPIASHRDEGPNLVRWLKATGATRKVQAEFRTMKDGERFELQSVYGRLSLSPLGLRCLRDHVVSLCAAEGL